MSEKIGRNDPCHCGSGQKYKRCHLSTDERQGGTGGVLKKSGMQTPTPRTQSVRKSTADRTRYWIILLGGAIVVGGIGFFFGRGLLFAGLWMISVSVILISLY